MSWVSPQVTIKGHMLAFPWYRLTVSQWLGERHYTPVCQNYLWLLPTSLPGILHQGLSYLSLIKGCSSVLCHSLQCSLQRLPPEGLTSLQKSLTITQQWAVKEEHLSVLQHELVPAQGQ